MKILKRVQANTVKRFFNKINKNRGNDGLNNTIDNIQYWYLVSLDANEFKTLECQTEPHRLLQNLDTKSIISTRKDINEKIQKLRMGKSLPALIIRDKYPWDMPEASFYLEDGTGKSIAMISYYPENKLDGVKAYWGTFNERPVKE